MPRGSTILRLSLWLAAACSGLGSRALPDPVLATTGVDAALAADLSPTRPANIASKNEAADRDLPSDLASVEPAVDLAFSCGDRNCSATEICVTLSTVPDGSTTPFACAPIPKDCLDHLSCKCLGEHRDSNRVCSDGIECDRGKYVCAG